MFFQEFDTIFVFQDCFGAFLVFALFSISIVTKMCVAAPQAFYDAFCVHTTDLKPAKFVSKMAWFWILAALCCMSYPSFSFHVFSVCLCTISHFPIKVKKAKREQDWIRELRYEAKDMEEFRFLIATQTKHLTNRKNREVDRQKDSQTDSEWTERVKESWTRENHMTARHQGEEFKLPLCTVL